MIGFLDCTSGVSGDKFLAALIGAGASPEAVRSAVAAVDPTVRMAFNPVVRGGIAALGVDVSSQPDPPHRSWGEIRTLIESAGLPAAIADRALDTFAHLAEAEATVHGTTPDDVHFHEVGAIDSIADIVGACAALHDLGLAELVCGPIALGSGTVRAAHGTLPVPAPATALLLKGVPVEAGEAPGEATTPTGAALIRASATSFGHLPPMVPSAIGHGAGTRETSGMPNVARLIVGERVGGLTGSTSIEAVTELVTTIDHLSPEHVADALARLMAAGALDVWQTSVAMKKGRLGAEVTALCVPSDADRLASLLIESTGTLGVRVRHMSRHVAARRELLLQTSYGAVRFKAAGTGESLRVRAEYDDVAAIAAREDVGADRIARVLEGEALAHLRAEEGAPAHRTR